jgi:hypothetical protein
MEIFRAEKIEEIEGDSNRECRACGAALNLIRTVHFPDTDKQSFEHSNAIAASVLGTNEALGTKAKARQLN